MTKAIQELGQLLLEERGKSSILITLLDTQKLNKIQSVFQIYINDNKYAGIGYPAYQPEDGDQYLYKRGAAQGGDYTPSSRLSRDGETKTFIVEKTLKRFQSCFKNLLIKKSLIEEDRQLINNLQANLTDHYKEIETEISKLAHELNQKDGYLITFVINSKTLSQYKVFENAILEDFYSKSYTSDSHKSIGNNQICSICSQKKGEVYGLSRNFSFYTLDKWSFITSGFDIEKAWRNYPVCPECLLEIEFGGRELMSQLRFSFCGFSYLLIPKLIISKSEKLKEVYDSLRYFNDPSLGGEVKQDIIDGENEVLDLFKDQKNSINLFFLFYKIENSAFRILLSLEGIKPSLIKELYNAQDKTEKHSMFTKIKALEIPFSKKSVYESRFTFKTIRRFFGRDKIKGNFDKSFLEIIGKIFTLKPISYQYLIARFMSELRYQFVNDYPSLIQTSDAFLILYFLYHLDLIRVKGGNMTYFHENEMEKEFATHFEGHKEFFNTHERCSTFLVGVLVQKLLNLQYELKNASPFKKNLNGLQITEKLLKKIFVKAQNKLIEYDKNYYVSLKVLTSKYFEGSDFTKISGDEISFYFVTGMNLNKLFLKKEDNKSDSSD